jgi:hypothetical protein
MHTITKAAGSGWIALCRGYEIGSYETEEEARLACADDAIEGKVDLIYDVAANVGQIVDNVKHMDWFRHAVAEEIDED